MTQVPSKTTYFPDISARWQFSETPLPSSKKPMLLNALHSVAGLSCPRACRWGARSPGLCNSPNLGQESPALDRS